MIIFHLMRICNFVSPIIVLLYTKLEVDLEQSPVKHISPELMGIILAVTAWIVPFMKTLGVEKRNGLSTFAVSTDSPHARVDLVKEYIKIPTPDRQGCSTGTVEEDCKDVEEVEDDGPSVGNGAYNTAGVVGNHFQKIKKSEVDTDLNTKDKNTVK